MEQKKYPYPLTMADGTPVEYGDGYVRQHLRNVMLKISDHDEVLNLDIVQIKYDIVLGMPWLRHHNPTVDWKNRVLTFPNCNHGKEGNRSIPNVPIARAIWVRPRGRMLAASEVALPPVYQEFQDLFTEKRGTAALPEHKPWDHEIPIVDGKEPTHYGGLIPLSAKEENFLKEYINEHLLSLIHI